jgi:alpha-D-ribose 1-methylphosphonate 5-triphosphate synthase subunit PhnH
LSSSAAQLIFRAVLGVLARPGTVRRLPAAAAGPRGAWLPAALLPVLALADLMTPVCVLADDAGAGAWDEVVRVASGAPPASLAAARLVSVLRPLAPGELAALRTGTPAAPEDGALACLAVRDIAVPGAAAGGPVIPGPVAQGTVVPCAGVPGAAVRGSGTPAGGQPAGAARPQRFRLAGPGIPGTRDLLVTGLPDDFAASRAALAGSFPAGADLLLVTPDGVLAGLPRTTRTVLASEESD